MLILSREAGDAIIIDGGIRIVVLACDRKGVRLGIEAPASVTILRSEIVDAIAEENRRANTPADAAQWLSSLGTPRAGTPVVPSPDQPAAGD